MSNSVRALFLNRHLTFSGNSNRSSSVSCTSANILTDLVSLGCTSSEGNDLSDAEDRMVSTTWKSLGIWPTEETDFNVGSDSEEAS